MPTLGELGLHQPALFALAVLVLGILPGGLMALCARAITQSLAG